MSDERRSLLARARRLEDENALLRAIQSPTGGEAALRAENALLRRQLDRVRKAPRAAGPPTGPAEAPAAQGQPRDVAEFNALEPRQRAALARRLDRGQRDRLLGRDQIMWVYGSGFPKSLDVSKAIDKKAGKKRKVVGRKQVNYGDTHRHPENWSAHGCQAGYGGYSPENHDGGRPVTRPATEAAAEWQGWGTALKPAHEPICVARKPLEGTVEANVRKWGTGALNIRACGVPIAGDDPLNTQGPIRPTITPQYNGGWAGGYEYGFPSARWPANLIHDGSDEVLAVFPQSRGDPENRTPRLKRREQFGWSGPAADDVTTKGYVDNGSAARFFYCAKASKAEREAGLEGLADGVLARSCQAQADARRGNVIEAGDGAYNKARRRRNTHETVKPVALMRYLCRLVTPPGGLVLDPFAGSGSTGIAAVLEGFRFLGVELDGHSCRVARARIAHAARKAAGGPLFAGEGTGATPPNTTVSRPRTGRISGSKTAATGAAGRRRRPADNQT